MTMLRSSPIRIFAADEAIGRPDEGYLSARWTGPVLRSMRGCDTIRKRGPGRP